VGSYVDRHAGSYADTLARYDEADRALETAVDRGHAWVRAAYGWTLANRVSPDGAKRHCRALVEEGHADRLVSLGNILTQQGEVSHAQQLYRWADDAGQEYARPKLHSAP
jgi:hypothetical protein